MNWFVRAAAAPFKVFNAVSDEVAKDRRLRLSDGAGWSRFAGRTSSSGKVVTIDSALQLSAAWACIKTTAQAVSSLPLAVYERAADDDRVRIDDDPVSEVLTDSPNADQTPLEFWEGMVAWLVTTGNAYAERMEINGKLRALDPLQSEGMSCIPERKPDGTLVYRVTDRGRTEELPRDKVFHLKGFGQSLRNRDAGLSPIAAGVNSLGAAMAAEEAAASVFANGMKPSGFFLFDQLLTPEQRVQARKALVDPMTGSGKTGSVGILEAGVKWQGVTLNPEDAQMLETRRFDVEDICRWWGMPPIIIGHAADGQTMWGSGVEQILLSWKTLGIDPICNRIEARIRKQLIRPYSSRKRYAEFNREAMLQMDSAAKSAFLSAMVQNGLMTRGEGRSKLNLPFKDGTDQLTAQTNLAPLDQLGATKEGSQLRAALRTFLGVENEGTRHDNS
ncbi:phage portal protein [Martelella endophytica]|uniref:Portal protein n=1 Tax=Martelella endophytica TaxID=1486262 RepID=A0A0D5LLM4_MAREN|nr:phage portal protein [Martelella endophytica]AJY44672.1 portal protein [Martelella endophytica]